jgi:hypothetical protein
VNSSTVTSASNAEPGSVQGGAAIAVLKKALSQDASSAEQLIAALPAPQLATSGSIGTQVNTFA